MFPPKTPLEYCLLDSMNANGWMLGGLLGTLLMKWIRFVSRLNNCTCRRESDMSINLTANCTTPEAASTP